MWIFFTGLFCRIRQLHVTNTCICHCHHKNYSGRSRKLIEESHVFVTWIRDTKMYWWHENYCWHENFHVLVTRKLLWCHFTKPAKEKWICRNYYSRRSRNHATNLCLFRSLFVKWHQRNSRHQHMGLFCKIVLGL